MSRLAQIGALIADPTRAELLTALMDGRAQTGKELARRTGVSASTTSEHLARLLDAGMVKVAAAGRHRYWQLAGPDVAELLEAVSAAPCGPPAAPPAAGLRHARCCYDHLAGALAVDVYDGLLERGRLEVEGGDVRVTAAGFALLESIGVDTDGIRRSTRITARACLDATERRHHLAGAAGAGLLTAMLDNRWLVRATQPRALRMTDLGTKEIAARLLA